MDIQTRELVQAIHDSPLRLTLVTAGAGTQALSDLLGVAGASRTLLEALVPYSEASFDEFLGQKPDQYVAAETAHLMAGRAYTRARWLDDGEADLVGIACTATIITDRPKLGEHRAHIATWQPERLVRHNIVLQKGARTRAGEEDVVSRLMLNALAQACGIDHKLHVPLVSGDSLEVEIQDFALAATRILSGANRMVGIDEDGQILSEGHPPKALLAGSFHPLHDGHIEMARVAGDLLSHKVAFELAVRNVDKAQLSCATTLDRAAQFAGRYVVYISNAPTFAEKAMLYPETTFVVGYDTARRILQPHYYGAAESAMFQALEKIHHQGCHFLVAGRVGRDGKFREIGDLPIPPSLQHLFRAIPKERFRKDISSTELRQTGRKGSR